MGTYCLFWQVQHEAGGLGESSGRAMAVRRCSGGCPCCCRCCGTAFAGALPPVTHRPPAAGVPAAGVPAAGVPAAGVPAAGVPAAGVPAAGVPAAGVPAAGVPAAGVPAAGVPAAGVPAAGVPAAGVPAAGVPAAGVPAAGVPAAGVPAAGVTVRAGKATAGRDRSSNQSPSGQDRYKSTGRLPASRLVSSSTSDVRTSQAFGPTSGMHVEVEGTASTGYLLLSTTAGRSLPVVAWLAHGT